MLHPVPEFRGVGEMVEAAPVGLAGRQGLPLPGSWRFPGSSVAPRALFRGLNLDCSFRYNPRSCLSLPFAGSPVEVGHLVRRPEMVFRMSMAIQAPAHAQRLVMNDDRHLVDLAVTADASHSALT